MKYSSVGEHAFCSRAKRQMKLPFILITSVSSVSSVSSVVNKILSNTGALNLELRQGLLNSMCLRAVSEVAGQQLFILPAFFRLA